jgi:NAD-dependent dihydropyrimidine dehydrogenase PreA subunit
MKTGGVVLLVMLLLATITAAGITYWVQRENCSGCGDCYRICPVDAVRIIDGKSTIDPELCIGCGLCQGVCTYDAIR